MAHSCNENNSWDSDSDNRSEEEVLDLFDAIEKGDEKNLEKFIDKIDEIRNGITPLYKAVQLNRANIVETLLNFGADINIFNKDGNTALHLAITNNYLEIAEMILRNADRWKVNIDLKSENNAGKTIDKLIQQKVQKYQSWEKIKNHLPSSSKLTQSSSHSNRKQPKYYRENFKLNTNVFGTNPEYDSGGLKTSLLGIVYQLQLLMVFVHNATKRYDYFQLATEMESSDKFDDVVIKYKNRDQPLCRWRFLQAKHKENSQKNRITVSDLTTSNNDPFSVQKYFLSFCRIKDNSEFENSICEEFTLCTNTSFDFEEKEDPAQVLYNEAVKKWKSYFSDENDIDGDKMLYFEGDVKTFKHHFNTSAKSNLCDLFRTTFLNKVDFNKIKEYISVTEYFKLCKLNNPKLMINQKFVEVENRFNSNSKKLNNTELADLYNKILELSKAIFTKNDYDKLNKKYKDLVKTATEQNTRHKAIDQLANVIDKLKKELKISQQNFDEYMNGDSKKFKDLSEEITKINSLPKGTKDVDITLLQILLDQNKFESRMDEFLEKFRIVTNYPNVDQLNIFLHIMLGDEFKLLNADLITDSFEKEILNWLRDYNQGKSHFLSKDTANHFFQEIQSKLNYLMASGLSRAYPEKLKTYGLHFADNIEFITEEQCVILLTNFTRLIAIKVLQGLEKNEEYAMHDSFIFVRIKTLLRQPATKKLLFESFKSGSNHNLLIIECQTKTIIDFNVSNLQVLVKNLVTTLESNPKKKLVIITNDANTLSDDIKDKYGIQEVQTDFNNLNEDSQKLLLDRNCIFQGEEVNLNILIDYKTAQQIFDEHTLTELVEGKVIEIGDEEPFYFNDFIEEYYIDRNLHLQAIKCDILKENSLNDMYFVTQIDLNQFIKLGVSVDRICKYENENTDITAGIIWCDANQDKNAVFQNLCDFGGYNIHWFEFHNDILYWKKSKGLFKKVHEHVHTENNNVEYFFPEDHFSSSNKINGKTVIVANDAGVGKSTFLTNLAKNLRKQSESLWIFRINLNDFAFNKSKLPDKDNRKKFKSLRDITFKEDEIDKAIDFFSDLATAGGERSTSNKFEKKLLEFVLKGTHQNCLVPKVVILFDGFDEICPTYSRETVILLKALSKTRVSQIYVTTRFHEKNLLENELQTPAFVLKDLEEEEQRRFLNKFWKFSLKFFKEGDKEKLREKMLQMCNNLKIEQKVENVSEAIEEVSDKSKSVNSRILRSYIDVVDFEKFAEQVLTQWKNKIVDNDTTFNVVPLHLRMLAEIIFYRNFQVVENYHILDLYNEFIEIKYNIFYDEKKNLGNTVAADEIRLRDTASLRKLFHAISFETLFPDENVEILEENIRENEKVPLARTGLLILKGNRIDFIHRSFAAYFLSEYTIKKMSFCKIQTLLLSKILWVEEYNFIREFLNSHLEREELSLKNVDFLEEATQAVKIIYGFDNVFHIAVHEGHIFTLNFLLDKITKYPEILKNLLLTIGKYSPILDEIIYHPIRRSTKANFGMLKVFIKKLKGHYYILEEALSKSTDTHGMIIVDGKQTSFNILEKIIALRKLELLGMLLDEVKENKQFVKTILTKSRKGLLNLASKTFARSTDNFIDLLNIFVDRIEDDDTLKDLFLSTDDVEKNCVLHTLTFRGTAEKLNLFLNWLSTFKIKYNGIVECLIATENNQKLTALEIGVYKENCTCVTNLLHFLKTHYSESYFKDITSNNHEKNILFKAISQGRSESTKTLLEWFEKNLENEVLEKMLLTTSRACKRNALQLACARNYHNTVILFLEYLKNKNVHILNEIILFNEGGKTALDEAIYWKNDDTVKTLLQFLTENVTEGIKKELIFKTDKYKNTSLHQAADSGTCSSLTNLLNFILQNLKLHSIKELLFKENHIGNTALHIVRNRCDSTKILLDFICQHFDVTTLKNLILKSNDYGSLLHYLDEKDIPSQTLQKFELILTLLLDMQKEDTESINFSTEELEVLQYYLKNFSKRENKEEICEIIDGMKTSSTISDVN